MIGFIKNIVFYIRKLKTSNFKIFIEGKSFGRLYGIVPRRDCSVYVGASTLFNGKIIFDRDGKTIRIGSRCQIGGNTIFVCAENIVIEDDVLISWGCTINDHNSHSIFWKDRSRDALEWLSGKKNWGKVRVSPIKICKNAWIGFNVIILKGVTIGEGAVVGAGSVVTKDVPPFSVVCGNPAKIIRIINE